MARTPHPFRPTFCVICRRTACIGWGSGPYTYACQECSEVPRIGSLPLDEWEKTALLAVDDAAGEYAAEHGTDMGAYTEERRMELWLVALRAWETSMKEQHSSGASPF